MEFSVRAFLQFVLSVLRYLGIDVYKIYIRNRQLRLWRRSVSKGQLRNDGVCDLLEGKWSRDFAA